MPRSFTQGLTFTPKERPEADRQRMPSGGSSLLLSQSSTLPRMLTTVNRGSGRTRVLLIPQTVYNHRLANMSSTLPTMLILILS